MQIKFFQCECFSPDHVFRTIKWEDQEEVSVSVILTKFPFWKRLKTAIKYVFGHTGHWEHFEEVILSKEQKEELINFLKDEQ